MASHDVLGNEQADPVASPATLPMRSSLPLLILLFASGGTASAQWNAASGWVQGDYYETRGASDVVCTPPYSVFTGYDAWGRPLYRRLQDCQRRDWHSWYGTRTGYRWAYNGYSYAWVAFNDTRTWWYFTWYNFTRSY